MLKVAAPLKPGHPGAPERLAVPNPPPGPSGPLPRFQRFRFSGFQLSSAPSHPAGKHPLRRHPAEGQKSKFLALISVAVACLALSSCTSAYRVEGPRGALAKRGTVRIVVNQEDSGDRECRSAVETELRNRGFRVSDSPNADLTVRMIDNWRWDIVMYLLELDLIFKDTQTGLLKAQAHYSNSPFHGYPSQASVVRQLFMEMDAKGHF